MRRFAGSVNRVDRRIDDPIDRRISASVILTTLGVHIRSTI
jgi:hypothetical protein